MHPPLRRARVLVPDSGSVMIIGDFWQPFCVGKNNGGRKARPRKTTIPRGRRQLLDSAWPEKLFARLTELSWSDVRDTYPSSRRFLLVQKSAKKITENRDTASLTLTSGMLASLWGRCFEFIQERLKKVFSCTQSGHNRPIVILRPGHKVRGIPVVRSCKKHCLVYFSEALFCLEWLWTTVYSSACLKDTVNVWWCARPTLALTGKSPDLSDVHPCRSRLSHAIGPGQSSWPELRKGNTQEEQSISS